MGWAANSWLFIQAAKGVVVVLVESKPVLNILIKTAALLALDLLADFRIKTLLLLL